MARNIEIKARLAESNHCSARAQELSETPVEVIHQEDVYFPCDAGRLKLRILAPERGELIFYKRPDERGPKLSSYLISPTADPLGLRRTLECAYGVRAVVKKTRQLYMVGRTRIHIDDVEGLGEFLELEVVMEDSETQADGEHEAITLMQKLGVETASLVDRSYVDLLESMSG